MVSRIKKEKQTIKTQLEFMGLVKELGLANPTAQQQQMGHLMSQERL